MHGNAEQREYRNTVSLSNATTVRNGVDNSQTCFIKNLPCDIVIARHN